MQKLLSLIILCAIANIASSQNVGIGTTTPTDQLHTTGTVRFELYKGSDTRMLQVDSTGRLTTPGGTFSAVPLLNIPDNGCGTSTAAESVIIVSGQPNSVSSSSIAVRVNITHTFVSDLIIYLIAPNGNILTLASAVGNSGDNFTNTTFSDAGTAGIATGTAPFTGVFKPSGGNAFACSVTPTANTFAEIGGGTINPNGHWVLRVFDRAQADVGSITNWFISFNESQPFLSYDQNNYIPKYSNGNLVASNISQSPFNGNIGIGVQYPGNPLEVAGNIKSTATMITNSLTVQGGTPTAGKVLTSIGNTGAAVWSTPPSLNTGFTVYTNVAIASITNNTFKVQFNTTAPVGGYDDGNNFDYTNNGYKAPASGVYQFTVFVNISAGVAAANGYISLSARVNNAANNYPAIQMSTTAGAQLPQTLALNCIMKLAQNDLVTFHVGNFSGGNINQNSGSSTQVSGVRIY